MKCGHYDRKCAILAPCCDEFYSCRFCHDEDASKKCKVERMDRHAVAKVRCSECNLTQAAAADCAGCGVTFAEYYCAVCKLYAKPTAAGIFHCQTCGICRVGRREDFFHCTRCNACFTRESKRQGQHVCLDDSLSQDCPICLEFMFTSREPLHIGPQCGHAMHRHCFEKYVRAGRYHCPMCQKPFVDLKSHVKYVQYLPICLFLVLSILLLMCTWYATSFVWDYMTATGSATIMEMSSSSNTSSRSAVGRKEL